MKNFGSGGLLHHVKREKIGGDRFTWIDLTAKTKSVKYERTIYGH